MEFRRAQDRDFDGMVALQDLFLGTNLTEEEKRDGFLSARFSAQQFAEMDSDLCVVVGVDDTDEIKAFLCASTPDYNIAFGLPRALVERFPHVQFEGRFLSEWKNCITGPVCIDTSWRGQGVIEKLYERLYSVMPGGYDLAVVFVAIDNPRSIKAHERLGMSVIDRFQFKERDYVVMACRVRRL